MTDLPSSPVSPPTSHLQMEVEHIPGAFEAINSLGRVQAGKVWALIAEVPEAVPLAREAPVLASLLASTARSEEGVAEIRHLLHQPRPHLPPLFGLAAAPWIVRAVTRMEPPVLQHLPALHASAMAILAEPELRSMATFTLLAEPASRDSGLARQLNALSLAGLGRRFRSRAAVSKALSWLGLVNHREGNRPARRRFVEHHC